MQACSQRQSKLTFTQVTLFLEEPINFKLSWLLIVFCQFAASFVLNIIPWILRTFMSIWTTMFLKLFWSPIPNALSAWAKTFLQHRKTAKAKKYGVFFWLENIQIFMSCLRCLKQHSVILESLQYFACKYWKITKISSFWISTEFSCFQDLKFILFCFQSFCYWWRLAFF